MLSETGTCNAYVLFYTQRILSGKIAYWSESFAWVHKPENALQVSAIGECEFMTASFVIAFLLIKHGMCIKAGKEKVA